MEQALDVVHGAFSALVSEQCADTFLRDFDFMDKECLSLSLSKALGYGVVAGAAIGK